MIYWASFFVLLAAALLACVSIPVVYVVWVRIVGLEPTVARRVTDLSRPARTLLAVGIGFFLGGGLQVVPSLPAGIALVTLVGSSTFAGLLLFELVANRRQA